MAVCGDGEPGVERCHGEDGPSVQDEMTNCRRMSFETKLERIAIPSSSDFEHERR